MRRNQLQTRAFWLLFLVVVGSFVANKIVFQIDLCLLVYAWIILLSAFCVGTYAWWWQKKRGASGIYKWLTLLMASVCYAQVWQFVARFLLLSGDSERYEAFLLGLGWAFRGVPALLAFIFMVAFIAGQIYGDDCY
jgi:hypothetical protein